MIAVIAMSYCSNGYRMNAMSNIDVMYSSDRNDWETPQALFDELNEKYHFTLDAAASNLNAKCDKFYTIENSGLNHSWGGGTCFL